MPKGILKNTKLPKRPGRKFIPIDWTRVEAMLIHGCSGVHIAATLSIDTDTLYDACKRENKVDWSAYSVEKRAKGDAGLHAAQYKKALSGNTQMLQHLGEHRLGQVKRIEQKIETNQVVTQRRVLELPDNGRRFVKKDENK
jgi:hypothetical protein